VEWVRQPGERQNRRRMGTLSIQIFLCARYPASGVCIAASSALVPTALPPLVAGENSPGLAQHFDNMLSFPILKSALQTGTLPGNFVP